MCVFPEAPPAWLMGSAVPCYASVLELAGTACVQHRGSNLPLLKEASPAASPTLSPAALLRKPNTQLSTLLWAKMQRTALYKQSEES